MAQLSEILTPQDLSKIANLQVLARLVVEGFTSGLHRSPHKGFSVEFKQHRQYTHGDEIRHVDWKLFGKTDRFYIREYEEETNLRATILLDLSGSMDYAGDRKGALTKAQYATRVAACLAYLMLQQRDSVGLCTFDTKLRRYIPPRSRPGHVRVLIDEMAASKPGGETELGKVFHDLVPKIHRRGLLIILSDLFSNVTDLMSALAHLRHARHEIIVFQIWDRDELEFPFKQWTQFDDLEVTSRRHMVDPATLRQSYLKELETFREELKQGCHRHRIDLVPLTTDQPYAAALAHYLASRKRRL
ncbi:MAG: DUF58 domain-containing protein [Phycisphaeraceae bacterium]